MMEIFASAAPLHGSRCSLTTRSVWLLIHAHALLQCTLALHEMMTKKGLDGVWSTLGLLELSSCVECEGH